VTGKPHLLDAMKILDSIWSKNQRYARGRGSHSEMLEESRDSPRGLAKPAKGAVWKHLYDSKRQVNNLRKEICDDFCKIMKTISTKATQTVDISKEGHGLSGSFVNEDLTQEEMEEAIYTSIGIEDDEDIQKAEMEEEIERLEQKIY
jgi:hypothetical protein